MKLTIIAPYYPPSALPPSQRVRLMMNHFAEYDVVPSIITVKPQFREESEDPWMVELVGSDHEVEYCSVISPKLSRKFGVGDLGLRMLPFLFFKLLRNLKRTKGNFVLYPVPPWYILVIAPIIKWLTGVPYAIDYIDPWVEGGVLPETATLKRKVSQWIAHRLEGWVTKNAAVVFAVSEGINEQLRSRHPELKKEWMFAVPYGAEESDFNQLAIAPRNNSTTLIRYIGAVWDDAYLVLDALLAGLSKVDFEFKAEFYGTSYAGGELAQPQMDRFIHSNKLDGKVIEYPNRVPYKEAVRLNLESDILFLFGGMQSYYAASKLFGLVVSKKPFIAFLHKDSYPALFLSELAYPYVVTYSDNEGDLPKDKVGVLKDRINLIQAEIAKFTPLDTNDHRIQKYTAKGMTASFVLPMKKRCNEGL
ncbi:hypothetical protein OAB47_06405 [Vicingaceae bacterium]|nr:hypothetical protein [Vicingaceae bacterium]